MGRGARAGRGVRAAGVGRRPVALVCDPRAPPRAQLDAPLGKREPGQRLEVRPETGTLHVRLERGSGLKAADWNGKSDPYVKLSLGGVHHQSRVVEKSLEPAWEQSFAFNGGLKALTDEALQLKVMDRDALSFDDHLGDASVDLRSLRSSREAAAQVQLSKQGSVSLRISWQADAASEAEASSRACGWWCSALVGMCGLAAPAEAAHCICQSRAESESLGKLRLIQAKLESAPQLFLQLTFVASHTFRYVAKEHPFVLASVCASLLSLGFSLSTFYTLRSTFESERVRSDLIDRAVVSLGVAAYFLADVALRGLAVVVLFVSLAEWQWAALAVPLAWWAGGVLFRHLRGSHSVVDCINPVRLLASLCVTAMEMVVAPAHPDSTPRALQVEFAFSTLGCAFVVAVGLQPEMPAPHVDPEFIANAVGLLALLLVVKTGTFAAVVAPALTHRTVLFAPGGADLGLLPSRGKRDPTPRCDLRWLWGDAGTTLFSGACVVLQSLTCGLCDCVLFSSPDAGTRML